MPSIIQVAVDTPVDRLFDYTLVEDAPLPAPGSLVEVSFGRTRQVGVVIAE